MLTLRDKVLHLTLLPVALAVAVVSAAFAAPGPGDERVIDVPGSPTVLKIRTAVDELGDGVAEYSIALDGRTYSAPRTTGYRLKLRHGAFDPLGVAAPPAIEPGFEAGEDTNLYVVQFVTQPLEAFRDAIRDLGGTVHFFLANHSHIVRMDPGVRDAVAALPYVRWVGPFHPAYRLEAPILAAAVGDAVETIPVQRYNIMVFEPGMGQKNAVAQRIQALGGVVDRGHAGKYLLEATLTPEQLFAVARLDEVLFIDRWSPYQTDMDLGREIGGANYLETIAGYTGAGVRGEVIDVGFNLTHMDFAASPLILHTAVGDDTHGAATSGIIFGDGTGDPAGRGLVPDAQGIVASTSVMEGQARYDHTAELVQEPYNCVFQSASVGSDRTFYYTTISADHDAMLFDFDILHCQSQSNAGDQDSRPQAWAKNVVSIGGVYHENTLTKSDDHWSFGASIGPASDGRIKPDLCHFYDDIYTVTCCSSTAYTAGFGGTSGATPIVAGHFGLFFEMWHQGIFQNPVDSLGTVFDNRCHMTTAKAMMINTAAQYDWNSGGPNSDIDRYKQGWGLPDLQHMHELRNKMLIVDETDLLTNLASRIYTVNVDPGEPALRATMTYADPAGVPGSTQHRINDLSLKITSPSGTVYWGNNGLRDGNWSTPGGVADDLDTVENVFVQNPEAGLWTVEVFAMEINQDGHRETFAALDADYALVVSGVEETLPPLIVRLTGTIPSLVPPGTPTPIMFEVMAGEESIVPGSEVLHYRFSSSDDFTVIPMQDLGGGSYLATVPGAGCGDDPEFYASAEGGGGTVLTSPSSAPVGLFGYDIGEIVISFDDDFEVDTGWTVQNEALEDGGWDRGVPAGGGDRGDPAMDFDGSGQCYLTDNEDGNSDVDGGPTILTSPLIDVSGIPDPVVSYARWFYNDDHDIDRLLVEISDDDGASWETLESVAHDPGWSEVSFPVADYAGTAGTIRLRFTTSDNPNDSVTEAGVDALRVSAFVCDDSSLPGDTDGDGDADFDDLVFLLSVWGNCPEPPADCPADFNGDGIIGFTDLLAVLSNWS